MTENNKLFHWMGPKKVLWLTENQIMDYLHPSEIKIEEGLLFRCQHHFHGTWNIGKYVSVGDPPGFTIEWTQVIIIKEK